jgi:toxin ParE1/3/4
MKRSYVIWPRVADDLTEHFAFIARDKVAPAQRLLEVAQESFELLAEQPSIGLPWNSKRPHLHGIHFYPMPSPYRSYIVFYRVLEERIEIVAVLHGARDLENAMRDILE